MIIFDLFNIQSKQADFEYHLQRFIRDYADTERKQDELNRLTSKRDRDMQIQKLTQTIERMNQTLMNPDTTEEALEFVKQNKQRVQEELDRLEQTKNIEILPKPLIDPLPTITTDGTTCKYIVKYKNYPVFEVEASRVNDEILSIRMAILSPSGGDFAQTFARFLEKLYEMEIPVRSQMFHNAAHEVEMSAFTQWMFEGMDNLQADGPEEEAYHVLLADSLKGLPPLLANEATKNTDAGIALVKQPELVTDDGGVAWRDSLSDENKPIVDLWRDSHTAKEIATVVHKSPGRVRNIITDLRKGLAETYGQDQANKFIPYHRT